MSLALYRRTMDWKQEARERLEKKRAVLHPGGPPMQFGASSEATAGEHVDSYWEYNRLVGESDDGELLDEQQYAELKRLAAEAAPNRLFVSWRNRLTGMDCYMVGPDSRCFCGHSYKAHAWYNTATKRVHCRCPGCECEGFDYVVGHGCFWIKCVCKHEHEHHRKRGRMGACTQPGCGCRKFHSSFSCSCGDSWRDHYTCIETRAERVASKRPTHALCGGGAGEAAVGGLTRMSSLIPGVDRIETPLPFTDAGFFAEPLPTDDPAAAREAMARLVGTLPEGALQLLLRQPDQVPGAEVEEEEANAAEEVEEEACQGSSATLARGKAAGSGLGATSENPRCRPS